MASNCPRRLLEGVLLHTTEHFDHLSDEGNSIVEVIKQDPDLPEAFEEFLQEPVKKAIERVLQVADGGNYSELSDETWLVNDLRSLTRAVQSLDHGPELMLAAFALFDFEKIAKALTVALRFTAEAADKNKSALLISVCNLLLSLTEIAVSEEDAQSNVTKGAPRAKAKPNKKPTTLRFPVDAACVALRTLFLALVEADAPIVLVTRIEDNKSSSNAFACTGILLLFMYGLDPEALNGVFEENLQLREFTDTVFDAMQASPFADEAQAVGLQLLSFAVELLTPATWSKEEREKLVFERTVESIFQIAITTLETHTHSVPVQVCGWYLLGTIDGLRDLGDKESWKIVCSERKMKMGMQRDEILRLLTKTLSEHRGNVHENNDNKMETVVGQVLRKWIKVEITDKADKEKQRTVPATPSEKQDEFHWFLQLARFAASVGLVDQEKQAFRLAESELPSKSEEIVLYACKSRCSIERANLCKESDTDKTKHLEDAKTNANECLKIDSEWAMGYYCLGLALQGLEEHQDAVEKFTTAFQKEKDDRQRKEIQRCLSEALDLMAKKWEKKAGYLRTTTSDLPKLRRDGPRYIPSLRHVEDVEAKANKLKEQLAQPKKRS